MGKLQDAGIKLNELSPLPLAFVGDGVFDLLVREYLITKGNCPVKKLHAQAVAMVNCVAQAQYLQNVLMPVLTEQEKELCKRGRNAHVGHIPKNADIADYHNATALECLFGYLYLDKNKERIKQLFDLIISGEMNE